MDAIYDDIFKKFLTKTYAEANYLLTQMSTVAMQADPENVDAGGDGTEYATLTMATSNAGTRAAM